jgi:hypothetical protein
MNPLCIIQLFLIHDNHAYAQTPKQCFDQRSVTLSEEREGGRTTVSNNGSMNFETIFSDSERVRLSIKLSRKSFRDVRSALGNCVAIASQTVLVTTMKLPNQNANPSGDDLYMYL